MGKISLARVGKFSYVRPMMLNIDSFIAAAEAYCARANIKLATLGAYAVGDKTLFDRLRSRRNVGVMTLQRVLDYMEANPREAGSPDTPHKDVA